jgi:hypothetical protein
LWETDEGAAWIRLLFFSVLYKFGLECGVGADRLSGFFEMIRLNTHIGISPSALRNQISQMEKHLPAFQTLCEKQAGNSPRKAVVAMDETFFGSFMILVLMDLQSGYLLLEDIAEDRTFDTWHKKVTPRLESLGIEVTHAISDRAKALIKLAITGFECESGADVFHAQQDVSRWLGSSIKRKVTPLEKEHGAKKSNHKQQDEAMSQEISSSSEQDTLKKSWEAASDVQNTYHANLRGVAEDIHPFNLNDQKTNGSKQVEEALEQRIKKFEMLAEEQGIADKKSTAQKFRNQIKALSSTVTVWWFWVNSLLHELDLETEKRDWLTQILLPVIHWHHQLNKTQNTETKVKYQVAWEQASHKLNKHPLTHKISRGEMEQWVEWSQWMVRQFHRSSSAVEGRNGCLSQMYHNGRGLTKNRLKALTVIHNYGTQRHDGTTAAMRLFNIELPNLFSWLLDEMGALPLPREARGRVVSNPMKLLSVPL